MFNSKYFFSNNGHKCVIIKVSDRDALLNMKKGEWWFRHPAYFHYEDIVSGDNKRGDRDDCKIREQHYSTGEITECINVDGNGLKGCFPPQQIGCLTEIYEADNDIDKKRLLCFYCLEINNCGRFPQPDKKMGSFGDSFAFVDILHLREEINCCKYKVVWEPVSYHDDKYCGFVGSSGKSMEYCYQNEYRAILTSDEFSDEISRDEELKALKKSYDSFVNIASDCKSSGEEQKDATKKYYSIYEKMCTKKKDYLYKVKLKKDCLSPIFSMESLFMEDTIDMFNTDV